MSDLESVISGEEPETDKSVEAQEPEQQTSEQQPEQQEAEAQSAEAEGAESGDGEEGNENEPTVPLAVFKSMRDDLKQQLDQFKRQIGQQQKEPEPEPVKPPDMFENPEAYQSFMQSQMQQMIASARADMSQAMVEQEYGKEAVNEALDAVKAQPALARQFMNDAHPYAKLMEWHQSQKVAQEIGPDPAAYREKLEKELRQKIEAEMAAKQAQEMAGKKAPSLAGVNGSGGNTDPGWQGPSDLNALIGE